MNPEYKQPWIDALRSGKYQQTRYSLKCNGKYCCLGVLLDINGEEWEEVDGPGDIYSYPHSQVDDAVLDKNNLERFGLDSVIQEQLTEMNDDSQLTFEEIADWISENL